MQIKHEFRSTIMGSKLVNVHDDDIKDGIFNCPDEVEVIGENAFAFTQRELITVLNFNKVKRIEALAFQSYFNLTTINAPQAEFIGGGAFSYCFKLITIDLPKVTIIEESAFCHCRTLMGVNLPQVITLKNSVFAGCMKLANIDLPKVEAVGNHAFEACKALSTVNAPQLENLGIEVFKVCEKLVILNLSKVKTIEEETFFQCSKLTTLILSPSVKLKFNEDSVKNLPFYLQLEYSELKQIIVNDLENPHFDKNVFIARLPTHLKQIEIILASQVLIKNLWHVKEILQQHGGIGDIETHISSFSHQLLFFPKVEQQPSIPSDVPPATFNFSL